MEIPERLKSGWDLMIQTVVFFLSLLCFVYVLDFTSFRHIVSWCDHIKPYNHLLHLHNDILFFSVHVWRRFHWLHRPSGRASVMPLRVDSSHQPCLSAPVLEAALYRQTTEYSVSASTECTTVYGLCQRSSLYVDISRFIISSCQEKVIEGFAPHFLSAFP